jgi:hypothetical protein
VIFLEYLIHRSEPSFVLRRCGCVWGVALKGMQAHTQVSATGCYRVIRSPYYSVASRGIPETDFEIFRSDSSVTVFFENGIGFRNFLSESVWCFTDRFLRLPVFVGITGFVSRNFLELCLGIFFGIFQNVIFSHRLYVSG